MSPEFQTLAKSAGLSDNIAGWLGFGTSQIGSLGQQDDKESQNCNEVKNGK